MKTRNICDLISSQHELSLHLFHLLNYFSQVVATNSDSGESGRITYSIKSSSAQGLFSINSDGDVTLQGSLNYETTESYTMVIMAEDNGVPKLSSTVQLEIFVIDINEQPRISCVFTVSEGRDSLDLGYHRGSL